jgi:hypothetical protein
VTPEAEPGWPLISVVVPFKNAAPYLQEAVESILSQTWTDIEVVLVDDGGDDGSDAIAHDLATAHSDRIRTVAHEGRINRGIGPSRAFGITLTRGALVAFLDADDVWEPTHLADHAQLLRENPAADMVCGRVWAWRSWADPTAEDELSQLAFAPGGVVDGPRLLAAVLRNGYFATTPCALTVRRHVVLGCVPHLDAFPGMYEDQVMNSWLQLRAAAVISGGTTAWYRQHEASFSAREVASSGQPTRRYVTFLQWLVQQLDQLPAEDREVRVLAERALSAAREHEAQGARRALRALAPDVVRRTARFARSVLAALRPPTADHRAVRAERLLFRFGADLRGDVLVVGGDLPASAAAPWSACELTSLPFPTLAAGPHHALASLPTAAHDCIVLHVDPAGPAVADLGVRHLRRALRPGGVLLVVGHAPRWQLITRDVRAAFGGDAVTTDHQGSPGPSRRPAVLLRAVVPVR